MILPGWPVLICSSSLSSTLALVGSLLIYILLTLAVLRVIAFDILDLCFFLPVVLLGLNPWHFATLGRFCNPSSGGWKLFSHLGKHNGCDKDHVAYLLPNDLSTLASPFPCRLSLGIRCFHSLLHSFHHILRLSNFAFRGCRHCGIFAFACLFCRLLVNDPLCCYTRLLHRRICWLLPLAQTLFLALFFLSLLLGPNDKGCSKKHLSLFRRRHLLLSFWLHSSVVYRSVGFHLSAAHTTWLLPATLGAYTLNENFLRIGSLTLPNFRWYHWVGCLTRTVLRRWDVTVDFAWLLLLFPLVSVLLAGNLTTIELALANHYTFLGHVATWNLWVPAFCEPYG
jgi:hypothetical protein